MSALLEQVDVNTTVLILMEVIIVHVGMDLVYEMIANHVKVYYIH